jgi:hypothetical protein
MEEPKVIITKICNWMLYFEDKKKLSALELEGQNEEDDDNILKALLYHRLEDLTIKFMGYYSVFLNKTLFLYSLDYNYNLFIQ